MADYKLEVTTGDMKYAGSMDYIYITLFGTEGQSERTELDKFGFDFQTGTMRTYTIKTNSSLGKLLLVKVEKDPFFILPEDQWYCSKIVSTAPDGEVILFPCYRWISRGELVELRGAKAMKVFEEDQPLLVEHRRKELMNRKGLYQWTVFDENIPHQIHFKENSDLPEELQFSLSKSNEIRYKKALTGAELLFKGMAGSTEQWKSFDEMKKMFSFQKTKISEYVSEHWDKDEFFGFQFLNATHSHVIKKCSTLPSNFPVTEEMVRPFLQEGSSLKDEMEKGNIFLCDQKIMDGIPTKVYNDKPLKVAAGLCLFYMNPENKLLPIAIQLQQQPSEQNPIFLPSDSETDWLLAKIFVKCSDSLEYQIANHLCGTHYMTELFAVAALRCFPVVHPLHKLLIPHFRFTFHINIRSRTSLLGPEGIFTSGSLGEEGTNELLRRGHDRMTYSTLCLPENISARGLESVPNFYYRDDGLKVWNIINRFVKNIVEYYYPSDTDVTKDTELQEWIGEIFTHGAFENKASGFPSQFNTVEELVKFITMVIFTASGHHAALHHGQFDYQSWMPNGTLLLHKSPPTTKGQSTTQTILETLPSVGETANFASLFVVLTEKYTDTVYLGQYPDERIDEPAPKQMIKDFQAELSSLSDAITKRNSELEVPYLYLNPVQIENSISI